MNKKFLPILLIGAVVLVGIVGAFTYRSVFAAGLPAHLLNNANLFWNRVGPNGNGGPMRGGGISDQDLANALGISVAKLQAGYKTATAEALKEAVSSGLITQSQADQMTSRGFVLRGFNGQNWLGGTNGINYDAILAKELGVSVDQLQAAYKKVFTANIDQAVKNGSLTQAQADLLKGRYALQNDPKFKSAMQSAYEAAIKQAVSDGVITQSQADQILKQKSGNGFFGFGFRGGPGGPGGPHGFGRLGKGRGNGTPVSPTPTAPSSGGL
jgi:hypothetical protein